MKYKWKDKVRIKSKKELECISEVTDDMLKNGGAIMTIACLVEDADGYIMKEDGDFHFLWSDEMIEGLVEELLDNDMEEHQKIVDEIMAIQGIEPIEAEMEEDDIFDDTVPLPDSFVERMTHKIVDSELFKAEPLDIPTMTTDFVKEHGLPCPNGYIFKDENGNVINATKIVLEKKKKEYPKTYEECLNVLGYDDRETYCILHTGADERLFESLYRLKVCRDAYWKIAGEEMGLGKPWEPDWKAYDKKYVIGMHEDMIYQDTETRNNKILTFPTEEMRDAFYENFKEEIEICKELL